MKQYLGVALGMVAGSVLGAAAVTGLNAQVKAPAVYLVTEIDVTNPDAYGKEFAPKAQATIRAAGGQPRRPQHLWPLLRGHHQSVSPFRAGTAWIN